MRQPLSKTWGTSSPELSVNLYRLVMCVLAERWTLAESRFLPDQNWMGRVVPSPRCRSTTPSPCCLPNLEPPQSHWSECITQDKHHTPCITHKINKPYCPFPRIPFQRQFALLIFRWTVTLPLLSTNQIIRAANCATFMEVLFTESLPIYLKTNWWAKTLLMIFEEWQKFVYSAVKPSFLPEGYTRVSVGHPAD